MTKKTILISILGLVAIILVMLVAVSARPLANQGSSNLSAAVALTTATSTNITSASVSTTSPSTLSTSTPIIFPKEITRGDTSKKEVIFTFDGGGTVQSADGILTALAKHHIKGTFFLTGKMIEAHPDVVKRIIAGGHEIFSHTYDHKNLTKLSADQITGELAGMEKTLLSTVGTSSKPYFRAPYGARDARMLAVAAQAGYQSVYWTIDARDWMQSTGETAHQVTTRVLSTLAPGNIYLMHLGDTITGDILDGVITSIEARGYNIVSLTQGI